MSESDTMFNERDRRFAAVQLMLFTDPSYDNGTIASTFKMQIRTVQRLRVQLNASVDPSDGYGYSLWCGFKWGGHHATSHLRSRLESQHQSVPGCAEECGDPLVQSGSWWQTLGVAAGLGRTRRRPTSPKRPRLGSSPYLNPLDYFVWSYVENITNMTSYNTKARLIACGKGMLPVPDLYRGGDWGWRRLHWIDVRSIT